MKEPEAKKKKLSKDDSSSGSDDEEAGVHQNTTSGFTSSDLSLSFTFSVFCTSQKNKGRKKLQNSEMEKDARRRKADEMRE